MSSSVNVLAVEVSEVERLRRETNRETVFRAIFAWCVGFLPGIAVGCESINVSTRLAIALPIIVIASISLFFWRRAHRARLAIIARIRTNQVAV